MLREKGDKENGWCGILSPKMRRRKKKMTKSKGERDFFLKDLVGPWSQRDALPDLRRQIAASEMERRRNIPQLPRSQHYAGHDC